eukprot:gnl/TRDRNA2_/TRDRNA2_39025_c0_seq1.p1 gnl/TRDRNA2_/TRDRNA2_39025_c0~~gnl/TRDRNA2_/TRDRNA2_39025_c0_seq1.p1  ORF type:complete len:342 (+),score=49.39 gnl/TRDRNA2_/TRDRNA2_39025_c0_seq1:42-1067(+)
MPPLFVLAIVCGLTSGGADVSPLVDVGDPICCDAPQCSCSCADCRSGRAKKSQCGDCEAAASAYVPTPAGLWYRNCVHELPSGTQIKHMTTGVKYFYPDGSEGFRANCSAPPGSRMPRPPTGYKSKPGTMDPSGHAYPVVFWGQMAGSATSLKKLTANYVVPEAPEKVESQVLYWWLGVEDITASDVLQPVLGWNGFGTSNWTFASWNCCPAGHVHYATPVNVSTGDSLFGSLDNTGGTGYTVVSRAANGKESILKSNDEVAQNMPLLSLETYNVDQDCALLPKSGMKLADLKAEPAISWDSDSPQGWALTACNWTVGFDGDSLVASPPTSSDAVRASLVI